MNKTILKTMFIMLISIVTFSCTKDENKITYLGGTAPVLTGTTNSGTNVINLNYANKSDVAISFAWTNPNYQFTTGVSSQDVSYVLEIDTTGSGFTNPNKQSISVSKDLGTSITVGTLNDYLLNQLVLSTTMNHNLEMRVTSYLVNSTAKLVSNTVKFVTKPYAIPPKVVPPSSGKLFLVGSATAGGWNNPVPVPTQQFTQVSPTLYEITVALIGGQEYLCLPVNGDWSHKYAVKDKTVAGLNAGGDFGYDLNDNIPGPAASGNYKISVDFQRGKFTVTAQ